MGDVVRAYLVKLRGGDVGSLPAILGLDHAGRSSSPACGPTASPTRSTSPTSSTSRPASWCSRWAWSSCCCWARSTCRPGSRAGRRPPGAGLGDDPAGLAAHPGHPRVLAVGAAIGLAIGLLVAKLGIPSFVVTLAAFLALKGVLLKVVGEGKTISYRNDKILALNNDQPADLARLDPRRRRRRWPSPASTFVRNARRRRRGLAVRAHVCCGRSRRSCVAVLVLAAVYYLSRRAQPWQPGPAELRLAQGRPDGAAGDRDPRGRAEPAAVGHLVGPARLRRRRQHRGGPPGRASTSPGSSSAASSSAAPPPPWPGCSSPAATTASTATPVASRPCSSRWAPP